jgi:hypothetical protein
MNTNILAPKIGALEMSLKEQNGDFSLKTLQKLKKKLAFHETNPLNKTAWIVSSGKLRYAH